MLGLIVCIPSRGPLWVFCEGRRVAHCRVYGADAPGSLSWKPRPAPLTQGGLSPVECSVCLSLSDGRLFWNRRRYESEPKRTHMLRLLKGGLSPTEAAWSNPSRSGGGGGKELVGWDFHRMLCSVEPLNFHAFIAKCTFKKKKSSGRSVNSRGDDGDGVKRRMDHKCQLQADALSFKLSLTLSYFLSLLSCLCLFPTHTHTNTHAHTCTRQLLPTTTQLERLQTLRAQREFDLCWLPAGTPPLLSPRLKDHQLVPYYDPWEGNKS